MQARCYGRVAPVHAPHPCAASNPGHVIATATAEAANSPSATKPSAGASANGRKARIFGHEQRQGLAILPHQPKHRRSLVGQERMQMHGDRAPSRT